MKIALVHNKNWQVEMLAQSFDRYSWIAHERTTIPESNEYAGVIIDLDTVKDVMGVIIECKKLHPDLLIIVTYGKSGRNGKFCEAAKRNGASKCIHWEGNSILDVMNLAMQSVTGRLF